MKSLVSIAVLSLVASTSAFMAQLHTPVSLRAYSSTKTVCEIPDEFVDTRTLSNAAPIRSAVVTNYEGDFIRIDDAMKGSNPHVVIYLLHMG
jgi:hypothetical protein